MPDKTLAQAIRAKYPDAYKNISDQDLEEAWLRKYPDDRQHYTLSKAPEKKVDTDNTSGPVKRFQKRIEDLGERGARAIEATDPTSRGAGVRAFLGGGLKGAAEQIAHPATWGGPQTSELIKKNVPGGDIATGVLNTVASPLSLAAGYGVRAAGPTISTALSKTPRIVQKGIELATAHPTTTGALLGGVKGGLEGGLPGAAKGALKGGAEGYAAGKLGKVFDKMVAGEAQRKGGTAAETVENMADKAQEMMKGGKEAVEAKPEMLSRARVDVPLNPKVLASEQGMRSAAGMPRLRVAHSQPIGVRPEGGTTPDELQQLQQLARTPFAKAVSDTTKYGDVGRGEDLINQELQKLGIDPNTITPAFRTAVAKAVRGEQ